MLTTLIGPSHFIRRHVCYDICIPKTKNQEYNLAKRRDCGDSICGPRICESFSKQLLYFILYSVSSVRSYTSCVWDCRKRTHTQAAFLHLPLKTHLDLHIFVLLASMHRLKFFSSFRERNLTYNIVLVQVVQRSDLIHVYIVT